MEFLKKHWKKLLCAVLVIAICITLISLGREVSDRSIIIGHPDNIVLISPEESQDVIVIGDPEQIRVKPKKN